MFGIGFQEMLIILVVVLIFFGPKRLPDLAKSLGKGIAEFKKASDEVRKGIEDAVKEETAPEAPKPPEDLSAFGKAPGSAPTTGQPEGTGSAPAPGEPAGTGSAPAPGEPAGTGSAPAPGGEPAGTGSAPAPAAESKDAPPPAPEAVAAETPATPPREG